MNTDISANFFGDKLVKMLNIRKYKDGPKSRINITSKTLEINWIITSLKIFKKKICRTYF